MTTYPSRCRFNDRCPACRSQTYFARRNLDCKGHCPACGPRRNALVLGEHVDHWDDEGAAIWGHDTYRILKCAGCERIYFQIEKKFSEDWEVEIDQETGKEVTIIPSTFSYWPAPIKRPRPAWVKGLVVVDSRLHDLLNETYTALDNELGVFAAIGLRTAIDCASELLKIDPAKTFAEKLDDLVAKGTSVRMKGRI